MAMAFLGHLILKQPKCWSNLGLSFANVSTQRLNRCFSNHTTETFYLDNPLLQEATITEESKVRDTEPQTFEELFKKSAFVSLGHPKGKIVVGTIKKVVEDDLYIDFGWKFGCVCTRPAQGSGSFTRGAKVRLYIRELELATKFLGSDVEVTLNEADCALLGLYTLNSMISPPKERPIIRMPETSTTSGGVESEFVSDVFAADNQTSAPSGGKERSEYVSALFADNEETWTPSGGKERSESVRDLFSADDDEISAPSASNKQSEPISNLSATVDETAKPSGGERSETVRGLFAADDETSAVSGGKERTESIRDLFANDDSSNRDDEPKKG